MILWIVLLICQVSLILCQSKNNHQSAFEVIDCNEPNLIVNHAKLYIDSQNPLFVTNTQCIDCVPLFFNSSSFCALVYTPYTWKFEIQDSITDAFIKSYLRFDNQGEYQVNESPSQVLISKTLVQPENTALPLILAFVICILIFGGSYIFEYYFQDAVISYFNPSTSPNDVLSTPLLSSDPDCEKSPPLDGESSENDPFSRNSSFNSNYSLSVSSITGTSSYFNLIPSISHGSPSHPRGVGQTKLLFTQPDVPSSSSSPLNHPSTTNTNTINQKSSSSSSSPPSSSSTSSRVNSLDSFRGFSLFFMIFVNYGGGGYWYFDHSPWNGLTFADLLFPWFIWMMGVSMALSFHALEKLKINCYEQGKKVIIRSAQLFAIGLFLANGHKLKKWRVFGVLQYFGIAYFVVSFTVLLTKPWTDQELKKIQEKLRVETLISHSEDTHSHLFPRLSRYFRKSRLFFAYKYEFLIQMFVLLFYLLIVFFVPAPGCPAGYVGPAGLSKDSKTMGCPTGGIHYHIDMVVLGQHHFYHHPTCLELYGCTQYDPEGILGSLSACTLTYLGLMAGRCLILFSPTSSYLLPLPHTPTILPSTSSIFGPPHSQIILIRWICWAFFFLFLSGCLCGFSQDNGFIPINKNLWSTSFVLFGAGSGLLMLSITYLLVDVWKVWSGAPFRYLGMNSILIYVGHSILAGYFPFSYLTSNDALNSNLLVENMIGTACWICIAFYLYRIKFFVKI